MKAFVIDNLLIEKSFSQAEMLLFNTENIYQVKYEDFDVTTFDRLNKEMLKNISNKCVIYCLWQGATLQELKPKYIGHAKNTIARQRIRNHLTKKNKATGAQLEKVKSALISKTFLGLTYLEIEPDYMRTALEAWLLQRNSSVLEWNRNK